MEKPLQKKINFITDNIILCHAVFSKLTTHLKWGKIAGAKELVGKAYTELDYSSTTYGGDILFSLKKIYTEHVINKAIQDDTLSDKDA